MTKQDYLRKSRERLITAEWSFERNFMNSAVSNCYYALFNAMMAILGSGNWRHGGIAEKFCEVVYKSQEFSPLKPYIKGFTKKVKKLYTLRKLADYNGFIYERDKERVKPLIEFAKDFVDRVGNIIGEEL